MVSIMKQLICPNWQLSGQHLCSVGNRMKLSVVLFPGFTVMCIPCVADSPARPKGVVVLYNRETKMSGTAHHCHFAVYTGLLETAVPPTHQVASCLNLVAALIEKP